MERRYITSSKQLDFTKQRDIETGTPLLPVVCQEIATRAIRMVANANDEAIDKTIETGLATFWSRRKSGLWTKGEESGNTMTVEEIWADCDSDVVIYQVRSNGPTCHTGAETCFDL